MTAPVNRGSKTKLAQSIKASKLHPRVERIMLEIVEAVMGAIAPAAQVNHTGAGALTAGAFNTLDSTAGAMAMTLADGSYDGQVTEALMQVDVGDVTVTLASAPSASLNVVTFADAGDYARWVWDGDNGYWVTTHRANWADGATAPAIS